jgi:hypothetical protein
MLKIKILFATIIIINLVFYLCNCTEYDDPYELDSSDLKNDNQESAEKYNNHFPNDDYYYNDINGGEYQAAEKSEPNQTSTTLESNYLKAQLNLTNNLNQPTSNDYLINFKTVFKSKKPIENSTAYYKHIESIKTNSNNNNKSSKTQSSVILRSQLHPSSSAEEHTTSQYYQELNKEDEEMGSEFYMNSDLKNESQIEDVYVKWNPHALNRNTIIVLIVSFTIFLIAISLIISYAIIRHRKPKKAKNRKNINVDPNEDVKYETIIQTTI